MKMKKTFLASVTAVALAAAMVPAVALAATQADTTQSTKVNYTVGTSCTWTVPSEVTFTKNAETDTQSGKVTVSDNVIPSDKSTQIALDTTNPFTVTSGSATRNFTVGTDASSILKAGDPVLTVASGTASGEQALTFKLLAPQNGVLQAGTYTGTVSYTAALV